MPYFDSIIAKYIDLIKSRRKDIKVFYNGIAGKVPSLLVPAVMIDIEKEEINEYNNIEDEHKISLVLVYIADIRRNFEDTPTIIAGLNKVKEVLVGRDEDYKLKTNSILHILRNNLDIDPAKHLRTDVGTMTVVTPNEVVAERITGFWSAEGTIRFTANFHQIR